MPWNGWVPWLFSSGAIASTICWTATCSFVMPGLMSSERGY
jgi:hypothetical protein